MPTNAGGNFTNLAEFNRIHCGVASKRVGQGRDEWRFRRVHYSDAVDAGVSAKRLADDHLGDRGWNGFPGSFALEG